MLNRPAWGWLKNQMDKRLIVAPNAAAIAVPLEGTSVLTVSSNIPALSSRRYYGVSICSKTSRLDMTFQAESCLSNVTCRLERSMMPVAF